MSDINGHRDAFWKLYAEHCTHVRHHESQRSTVATIILAIASALIGIVTYDKSIVGSDLPLTILLTAIGAFGALFSAKQYERASLHTERARRYRDAADATLETMPIKALKQLADAHHSRDFPRLEKLRLHKFWVALYLFISTIGILLSTMASCFPYRVES
jgi:hypothetical protein